jgi:hypothetical protein
MGAVNAVTYVTNIRRQFFAELAEEEKLHGFLRQDLETPHTAHVCFEALRKVSGGLIISRGLWTPSSLDVTLCDLYLWGSLKR